MRRLLLTCLLGGVSVLSVAGIAAPAAAQAPYIPGVVWEACPFPLPATEIPQLTINCGYLYVPEDRADPQGVQVELAVAVLHSTGADPAPDPLIYLEGGPGGSALSGVELWYDSLLREDRDIVLIDQRGTGFSYPRLYCWELDELDWDALDTSDPAHLTAEEAAAITACTARLTGEEGVDLSDYATDDAAADIADLRVALGYDEVNLFGISYGTRIALTVLRDHPAGVRSVVLDSTYPPLVDAYEEEILNVYRAFRHLFDDCAADAACSAAYPDLEARFVGVVARLNADPVYVDEYWPALTGDDLLGVLFELFYDTAAIPYLPLVLNDLDAGNYDTLVALYDGYLTEPDDEYLDDALVWNFTDEFYLLSDALDDDTYYALWDELLYEWEIGDWDVFRALLRATFAPDDAAYLIETLSFMSPEQLAQVAYELLWVDVSDTDGLYNSVECNDEIPFNSVKDAALQALDVPEPYRASALSFFDLQRETCALWPAGTAGPVEDQPVFSDVPTLVVAGEYDPITPPEWGRIAAETLSNSTFLTFPGVGHSVIDGGDCPFTIIRAFLNAPGAAPDTACLDALIAPVFVLP